jgi:hypothetical protein
LWQRPLRKYLSCQELHTELRFGLPLRQPRKMWAATISREIRCHRVLHGHNRRVAHARRGQFIRYSLVPDNLVNTLNGYVQEVCPVSRPLKKESARLAKSKA